MRNLIRSGSILFLALAVLCPAGPASAREHADGQVRGCKGNSAGRLARAARAAGLEILEHRTAIGSSHGICYVAAPLAGAAHASGDDLLDGVALALMELDGRVLVLEAQADPAAIQEARDAWQSGLPTRPGNATCRLVDADGAAGDPYPCDLQAVKDLGGAGLPDDGATLDAGALVRRDDAAGQAAVGVRITVWVEGWGIRVCGSVDF